MQSLVTPMLILSLGIHGALLLIPTSKEEKSTETSTEIAQAVEVENQVFSTSEAKLKSVQESPQSKLSQPKEDKKASLPSPKTQAVANVQTPVARRTQGQRQTTRTRTNTTNTRSTPQPQARKTQSGKTNRSNSQSSRQSQSNSNPSPPTNSSASAARENNSQNASRVSRQQKNVPSSPTTANLIPTATQRRVDTIPTFTQRNNVSTINSPTSTSVPVISSLAPSNSNTNSSNTSSSTSVTTVPTIIARTQNQDERVTNRLEFLKTFPRYPQAQWGLPNALQGEEVKKVFYRLQTKDGIEVVAKKFREELLPQSKFTGELNTDEDNWQVYQVSNGKHTQYLHLISQEGNTGIFLASEEFSRADLIK